MATSTFQILPAEKRERITNAAIFEFASHPYTKANLDRIAKAAKVPKGSLYQYFDGKAGLYLWLMTTVLPEKKMAAIQMAAPAADASLWDVLESAFLAGIHFAAREPLLTQLGVRFMRDNDVDPVLMQIAIAHQAAGDAWLTDLIKRGQAQGDVRSDLNIPGAVVLLTSISASLPNQLAQRIGVPLAQLLDATELIEQLTDDDLLQLVRDMLQFIRHGVGGTQ